MVVDLAESRKKIDEIDQQIEKLFEERMEVAKDVAAYKRSTGKKVYDPVRENEKIAALGSMASNEFNKMGVEELFRQIMSISRKYQYQVLGAQGKDLPFRQVDSLDVNEDTRVVYFGEPGSYTQQAMHDFFGKDITEIQRGTFKEVMDMVANGDALYGVLPIENSSTGGITDIYDLLADYDVTSIAEHDLKVEQALVAKPGTKMEDIKTVYSHPQGLMQCSKFLEEHPWMKGETYASTSAAAKKVAEDKDDMTIAAISSTNAADYFGLEVLQESINFKSQNYTKFIIISNQKIFLKDANKISLSFEIKHEVGALYNMLSNFYFNDLNMTKIESRPVKNKKWEYRFFVDIEGNLNDSGVSNAIECIKELVYSLKIIGNIKTK